MLIRLIAETAFHHQGDVDFLKGLLRSGAKAGADILKIHMLLDKDEYMHKDHELYTRLKDWLIARKDWKNIFSLIRSLGKDAIGLANCTKSVEFMMRENVQGIELHSSCLCDLRLLDMLSDFQGKVFLGIGGSTLDEVDFAVNYLKNSRLVLMTGFQNYPTKIENLNFKKTLRLMSLYPHCEFGYADHTAWDHSMNLDITLWGAALGVDYIEKHITSRPGVERIDFSAAIGAQDFRELRRRLQTLDLCMGNGTLGLNKAERDYSQYGPMKKAAISIKEIKKGQKLSNVNVTFQRTANDTDLSQGEAARLLTSGVKSASRIPDGTVLRREHLDI